MVILWKWAKWAKLSNIHYWKTTHWKIDSWKNQKNCSKFQPRSLHISPSCIIILRRDFQNRCTAFFRETEIQSRNPVIQTLNDRLRSRQNLKPLYCSAFDGLRDRRPLSACFSRTSLACSVPFSEIRRNCQNRRNRWRKPEKWKIALSPNRLAVLRFHFLIVALRACSAQRISTGLQSIE